VAFQDVVVAAQEVEVGGELIAAEETQVGPNGLLLTPTRYRCLLSWGSMSIWKALSDFCESSPSLAR